MDEATLTFDCYGTLIDWSTGITAAFTAAAGTVGETVESGRLLELHARIEPEVQAERYRPYRQVLSETARRMAADLGFELPAAAADAFGASVPAWPPFADTSAALERLRRGGYRLAILSNIDDDLLAATIERLAVPFDFCVTAQQMGSYKPATAHFAAARERIGEAPWTHVAQSLFHDIRPALDLGIPPIWINRQAEAPPEWLGTTPVYFDLESLAEALA